MDLTSHVVSGVLAIAVPGPVPPPGMGGVTTMLSWGSWAVSVACIAGVLIVAAMMAVAHHNGRGGGQHVANLGWVMGACVLGAAAGPLVSALGV